MLVSVIIPALNEAGNIRACIVAARRDGTRDLIPADVTLIPTERGRAVQMNRGAAASQGELLLFCHADSRLPAGWRAAVLAALSEPGVSGGVFRTQILPEATWLLWLRNRQPMSNRWWEKHGDQAQFMNRVTALVDKFQVTIQLAHYPSYHSKYNPIERVWGVLENHWHSSLLGSVETVLNLAEALTWNGQRPAIHRVEKAYQAAKTVKPVIIKRVATS